MSAFDRLQGYSSRGGVDKTFEERVTEYGFKLVDENGSPTELATVLNTDGNQRIHAVAGGGKALVHGTRVFTPTGWKCIESMQVGDEVVGTDGKPYKVTGVYPQGKLNVYQVSFIYDDAILCNGEHLWGMEDGSVKRTDELKAWDRLAKLQCGFGTQNVADAKEIGEKLAKDITEREQSIDFLPSLVEVYNKMADADLSSCITFLNVLIPKLQVSQLFEFGLEGFADWLRFMCNACGLSYVADCGEGADEYLRLEEQVVEVAGVDDLEEEQEMTCISVDSPDHLYIVQGFIPTHNTTAMTLKIIKDLQSGESTTLRKIPNGTEVRVADKVWVCTFLRSGAKELELALSKMQRSLGYMDTANQIVFSTLDAEFKRCLNAMGIATNIGSAEALGGMMKKAIDSCNIKRQGYPLSKEDYKIIESIVAYYRGRLDDKKYQHPACADYELTPSILDLLVKQFANQRSIAGVLDFDEISELMYKYLYVTPNKAVQEFVANRYNFIYIDEFQDTSQLQYAILKFYARGHLALQNQSHSTEELFTGVQAKGKIVVVGDVSQCIYSFKGSDSKIIAKDFINDFAPTDTPLSYNYRCPSDILNPVVPSIHLNSDSASQVIKAKKTGGECKAYSFGNYRSMLAKLMEDLEDDMDAGRDVAILCRTNYDGLLPALMLESNGKFNFNVSGDKMTLNSPLPRKLIGVASLFTERSSATVKNTLEMFCGRNGGWQVKQLIGVLKANNLSIWQVPNDDLEHSCPDIADLIVSVKNMIMVNGVRDKQKEVEALRSLYQLLMTDTFGGDSAYCDSARAIIEVLMYIIDNHNFSSVGEYLDEVELLGDKLNGRLRGKSSPILISTVHEFKGKERDSVYVWNDSDQVFPSSKCSTDEELEEERRVHYIACTRAKLKETIYTQRGKEGQFLKEMSLTIEPYVPKIKHTL